MKKSSTPFDDTVKRLPHALIALLSVFFGEKIELSEVKALPTGFAEILKRFADFLFLVAKPSGLSEYIHIECQSAYDADMPVRMNLYACLIKLLYNVWPKQFVINLYKTQSREAFAEESLETENIKIRYTEINIHNLEAKDYVDNESLQLCILSVLMFIPAGEEKDHLEKVVDRILKDPKLTHKQKSDRLNDVHYLCNLRDEFEPHLEKIIGTASIMVDITKTVLYGKGHNKGKAEGIKEGAFNTALNTALKMWQGGEPLEKVRLYTDLSDADWKKFLALIKKK